MVRASLLAMGFIWFNHPQLSLRKFMSSHVIFQPWCRSAASGQDIADGRANQSDARPFVSPRFYRTQAKLERRKSIRCSVLLLSILFIGVHRKAPLWLYPRVDVRTQSELERRRSISLLRVLRFWWSACTGRLCINA